jgi:hypothetical protein
MIEPPPTCIKLEMQVIAVTHDNYYCIILKYKAFQSISLLMLMLLLQLDIIVMILIYTLVGGILLIYSKTSP